MPLCYDDDFIVYQYECDPWDRMTAGAALRRIQEASNAQCDSIGLTFEAHDRTHTVFLLSKMSLRVVSRMPHLYEKIHIQTRAYGMRRATFHRVTSLHTAAGEKLCEADTRWMLVDTTTRRILRTLPDEFAHILVDTPGAEEHDMNFPHPTSLVDLGEFRAGYSLCDRNGHLNNTRYADIMCDHLPITEFEKGPPQRVMLYFRAEIPFNHTFTLGSTAADDGYYFLASEGGKKSFEGFVSF